MMQQYWQYREEIPPDALLLFRLGDFYEMFHADAEAGARLLGITLTKRQNYPMAGIPYHAADAYIPKLLQAGHKVAIVDQVETPQPGKLVKRALTRILTPGTALEESHLDAARSHFLLAFASHGKGFQAGWLDLSAGDFQIAQAQHPEQLNALLEALNPREILLPEQSSAGWAHREDWRDWYQEFDYQLAERPTTTLPDDFFELAQGHSHACRALGVLNLEGFGIAHGHPALGVAGALLRYAEETLCAPLQGLTSIREYKPHGALLLDPATQRNLEVFRSAHGTVTGSLLEAIDHTRTAPGKRQLEQWLAAPSRDLDELQRRQQCIQELLEEPGMTAALREALAHVRDLPRILGRLQNRLRHPRELGGVRDSLAQLPALRAELDTCEGSALGQLASRIELFPDLDTTLSQSLNTELPTKLDDGGVIAHGWDEELDRLRGLTRDNQTWISDLEAREQQATGIKNLKVKYNGAFGYFIEVTKANLALVPEHYVRRQTMVNAERYVTDELRQKEKEILHAEEKALAREAELFAGLVEQVLAEAPRLRATATALAELDVLAGWAVLARQWDYCRPELDESDVLEISEGRHPVIEQKLRAENEGFAGTHTFVPNDTQLSASREQIALITGPNMAGKSTFIRQVALITLLAQVGCWVPARRCRLGLVDRIFSRIGASDELARGNSTFMVEMNETANILNHATSRSLVILDEIGRGTSTYDGLSIAWAVMEHLHEQGRPEPPETTAKCGPRTLFATHYHELTRLEDRLPRLRNYCVSVKEWNDEIIFVRQVVPGAADRSYGIQVARLAGLPASVIARAKVILESLENQGSGQNTEAVEEPQNTLRKRRKPPEPPPQLSLF